MDVSAAGEAYGRLYYDATAGAELAERRVMSARFEELEEFERRDAYAKVLAGEALEKAREKPISARRVDVSMGDDRAPEYRSRLVAREVKRSQVDNVFAEMPPLGTKRELCPLAAGGRTESGGAGKLSLADAMKAHLHAPARSEEYVQMRSKDAAGGRLNVPPPGARGAGRDWEEKYTEMLCELGVVVGKLPPRLFANEKRDMRLAICGDDVATVGNDESLSWLEQAFGGPLGVKARSRLGIERRYVRADPKQARRAAPG